LDDLLIRVSTSADIYTELDQSLQNTFKSGQSKYIKYASKLNDNSMLYAAYILNPHYRLLIIKAITLNSANIIENVKEYFLVEWSTLGSQDIPVFIGEVESSVVNRPPRMSLVQ